MSSSNIYSNYNLNPHYVNRIRQILDNSLQKHPRLTIVRVDLRVPGSCGYSDNPLERDTIDCLPDLSSNVIKRFFASLKSQIESERRRKEKQGTRVHFTDVNFIWTREVSKNHNLHYHLAIILNKDRYYSLGNYQSIDSLASKISIAWCRALSLPHDEYYGLVHFPENPNYTINKIASLGDFNRQLSDVLTRLNYLAKNDTKVVGTGQRNFGCSNPKKWGANPIIAITLDGSIDRVRQSFELSSLVSLVLPTQRCVLQAAPAWGTVGMRSTCTLSNGRGQSLPSPV